MEVIYVVLLAGLVAIAIGALFQYDPLGLTERDPVNLYDNLIPENYNCRCIVTPKFGEPDPLVTDAVNDLAKSMQEDLDGRIIQFREFNLDRPEDRINHQEFTIDRKKLEEARDHGGFMESTLTPENMERIAKQLRGEFQTKPHGPGCDCFGCFEESNREAMKKRVREVAEGGGE